MPDSTQRRSVGPPLGGLDSPHFPISPSPGLLTDEPAEVIAWRQMLDQLAPCLPSDFAPRPTPPQPGAKQDHCDELGIPFTALPMCL